MNSKLLSRSEVRTTQPEEGWVEIRPKREILDNFFIPVFLVGTMLAAGIVPILLGH